MNTVLTEQVGAVLDDLRDARTYKRFLTLESPQGPVVRMEGRGEVIVLSSNNYLGLAAHPEVVRAGIEGLERYGAGTASVRFICGTFEPHHTGQTNTPLSKEEWREYHRTANAGALPPRTWNELYLQTVFDRSVVPEGLHTLSVFAQYVPHRFEAGDWDSRREEVGRTVADSIARFCTNLPRAIVAMEVLGPPDIERKVGLSGGHIFQGECLPAYMWDKRLSYRTPMDGVYLCGAATHPGGSVIAVNGRNAAMAVLRDCP